MMKKMAAVLLASLSIAWLGADEVILKDGKVEGKLAGSSTFSPAPEREGVKAMEWIKMEKGTGIMITPTNINWSQYDTLKFDLYSPETGDGAIMLTIYSEPENATTKGNYYNFKITLDFKGWKSFAIPFKKMAVARKPAGFNKIDSLVFNSKGWNIEPKPGMKLWVDNIALSKTEAPAAK